ncbi:BPSL0067 family protein [Janthinobacterium sp. YR213]
MVGNHQCVALVRHYAGAPATSAWKQGGSSAGKSFAAQRHSHCHVYQR